MLYLFRLRCGRALKKYFHAATPTRPAPIFKGRRRSPALPGRGQPALAPLRRRLRRQRLEPGRRHRQNRETRGAAPPFPPIAEAGRHCAALVPFLRRPRRHPLQPAGNAFRPRRPPVRRHGCRPGDGGGRGDEDHLRAARLPLVRQGRAGQRRADRGTEQNRDRRLQAAGPAPARPGAALSSATAALRLSWPGTSSTSPSGPPAAGAGASSAPRSLSWPCAASSRG